MKNKLAINFIKKFISSYPSFNDFVLKTYFRSIIYRKKHIKKENFKWLKDFDLFIVNEKEGILNYENFQFILPKKKLNAIPLHQKYLYCSLIRIYDIPKYYLLFWDDLIVFHEIFIDHIYDKDIVIKNGDIVFDIGASIGWFACKISDLVGDNGRIFAIEPNPSYFHYLKRNIELNKFKNITIKNLGVWSVKDEMYLFCDGYGSKLKEPRNSNDFEKFKKIKLDTLDNIIFDLNLNRVNLIKIDIEGAEVEAIIGAKKVLQNLENLNLIIAAYHKNPLGIETYKILVPILKKLNFQISPKNLPFINAQKCNNVFVK